MHYLYILQSETLDAFYVGSTSQDPIDRLKKHLTNHSGYTAKAKDWKIVYTEQFLDKTTAIKREKLIKNWKNKQRIRELILNS